MLKYWLWLTNLPGVTLRDQTLLLRHFESADEVYFAGEDLLSCVEGLNRRAVEALEDKDLSAADRIAADCYGKHIQILTCRDAAYPNRLRAIDQPPPVLYCVGRLPSVDTEPAVAIVGTRSATAYGLRCAKQLGYQIGRCGGTVISGMAKGIDAMAMEGALSANAQVIGVLGCGVDVVYPRENRALFQDVAGWGCLLSEYPPGTPPDGRHFPVRNRIISALALGVLVVEAPLKSGALITANLALEQGRDVYAVPGSIDAESSAGCNQLIREGAMLVSDGWEIMQNYLPIYPGKVRNQRTGRLELTDAQRAAAEEPSDRPEPKKTEKKAIDKTENKPYSNLDTILSGLEGDERTLAQHLADGPLSADELIERSQLPAARVMATLTLLEVQGVVRTGHDKRVRLSDTANN